MASALGLAVSLAACGGGHTASVPAVSGTGSSAESAARAPESISPLLAVPKPSGPLAYTDAGRRPASAPVNISITLRYNNQAQLDQFVADVSDPHSPSYRHFITPAQFNSLYAPTAQQEQSVMDALQRAGFTVTQRFPNRTIVDATAPASAVERFFSTEMHTVHQGKYGDRFANLTPATVPAAIASYVRTASLSNVVVVRTKVDQAARSSADNGRVVTPAQHSVRPGIKQAVRTDATNILSDPGFESGGFAYWPQCGNASAAITTAKPHTGSYSERSGTTTTEPNGDAGVCQAVTIPASGQLTFWVWQSTNETSTAFSYQEADLLDSTGAVIDNLYTTVSNAQAWVQKSYNLTAYAGRSVYLYFGVHGDGSA
ncbi:MAG TPA: protease pro-enzyme activation domain-containing protein, partial [Candidatus Elarobacter sp.]|nr:protease pro-enzyme activation domain-containing protein [Candidatus Elarobacter sp.]